MLQVIPTYLVYVEDDATERIGKPVRVPKTNLEAFLHVLIFNDVTSFSVQVERSWASHSHVRDFESSAAHSESIAAGHAPGLGAPSGGPGATTSEGRG